MTDIAATFAAYPDIHLTPDNIAHYEALGERRLVFNRCGDCGHWIIASRPLCPQCWSWNVSPREVSGLGRVFMFTLLYQLRDPASHIPEPMPVAAVELVEQDGLRYLARIVNCPLEVISHDMPVQLTWIDLPDGSTWPAFEPFRGSREKVGTGFSHQAMRQPRRAGDH